MGLSEWELRDHRRRLAAGDTLSTAEQVKLLSEVELLASTARLPAEFLVRAHRSHDPSRWEAEHPLLRINATANNPGDALILAGAELNRVLSADYPQLARPEQRRLGRDVNEAAWEALAAAPPSEATVSALSDVLEALHAARKENAELRYGRELSQIAAQVGGGGAADARAQLRARHRDELGEMNVAGADISWSDDAFGPAGAYGIALPALVAATRPTSPNWLFGPQRFPDGFVALAHHWPGDDLDTGSGEVKVFAKALPVTPEAELGLRRLAESIPDGDSIAAHVALHSLACELLPGTSVDKVSGRVCSHCIPFDWSSFAALTGTAPGDNWPANMQLMWLSAD